MAKTDALVAGVHQYIADMSDAEFDELVAEVREPDTEPPTRTVADGRARFKG